MYGLTKASSFLTDARYGLFLLFSQSMTIGSNRNKENSTRLRIESDNLFQVSFHVSALGYLVPTKGALILCILGVVFGLELNTDECIGWTQC